MLTVAEPRSKLFRMLSILIVMAISLLILQQNVSAEEKSTATTKATTKPSLFNITKLSSVKILTKSDIQIQNLQMQRKGSEKYIYFNYVVHNGESRPINTIDYWVSVSSKKGYKFTASLVNKEDTSRTIQPNSTLSIPMQAKVNYELTLGDLKFGIVKWDFSVSGFQRTLGTVSVPGSFNNIVPEGKYVLLNHKNSVIKTYIEDPSSYLVGGTREVALTFNFENNGNETLELPKLNYYIRTGNGNIYKMDTVTVTEGTKIIPKQIMKVRAYAKLPTDDSVKSMQVYSVVEDTKASIEYPLSYYALSVNTNTNAVKYGSNAEIYLDDKKISTKVRQVFNDNGENEQNIQVQFQFVNSDKASVKFPELSLSLISNSGTAYPMTISNKPTELSPKISKEITAEGLISTEDAAKPIYLALNSAVTETNKESHILAIYELPVNNGSNTEGNSVVYENQEGRFLVQVQGLQRMPWNSQDLINVYVDITNVGTTAAVKPELISSIVLDGYKIADTSIQNIALSQGITLAKNQTASYAFSTKIPYSTKYQNAYIVLTEKKSSGNGQTIGRINLPLTAKMPTLNVGQSHSIDLEGRKAQFNIVKYNLYSGTDYDIAYAELSLTNQETRLANLPSLTAFFSGANGYITNATVIQSQTGTSPGENNLVKIYAKFPKKMPLTNLELFVGESVTNGQFTTGNQAADGVVNLVKVQLPQENKTVSNDFPAMIAVNPFQMSLNRVNTVINGSSNMKLYFNYDLIELGTFNEVTYDHKLTFEVVIPDGKFETSIDLNLEKNILKTGKGIDHNVEFNDSRIGSIAFSGYTLNVYDEFEGGKKLLMSKQINSFDVSN